jgi:hypothetical protein
MPVRRQDLKRRIKPQRAKLLKILQAYAVMCVGVKFTVSDIANAVEDDEGGGREPQKKKTKKTMKEGSGSNIGSFKFGTGISTKLEQTVSAILGPLFLQGLTRVSVDLNGIVEANKIAVSNEIGGGGDDDGNNGGGDQRDENSKEKVSACDL